MPVLVDRVLSLSFGEKLSAKNLQRGLVMKKEALFLFWELIFLLCLVNSSASGSVIDWSGYIMFTDDSGTTAICSMDSQGSLGSPQIVPPFDHGSRPLPQDFFIYPDGRMMILYSSRGNTFIRSVDGENTSVTKISSKPLGYGCWGLRFIYPYCVLPPAGSLLAKSFDIQGSLLYIVYEHGDGHSYVEGWHKKMNGIWYRKYLEKTAAIPESLRDGYMMYGKDLSGKNMILRLDFAAEDYPFKLALSKLPAPPTLPDLDVNSSVDATRAISFEKSNEATFVLLATHPSRRPLLQCITIDHKNYVYPGRQTIATLELTPPEGFVARAYRTLHPYRPETWTDE